MGVNKEVAVDKKSAWYASSSYWKVGSSDVDGAVERRELILDWGVVLQLGEVAGELLDERGAE